MSDDELTEEEVLAKMREHVEANREAYLKMGSVDS